MERKYIKYIKYNLLLLESKDNLDLEYNIKT